MQIEVCTYVDYYVDEIIDIMSPAEKREMFEELAKGFKGNYFDKDLDVAKFLAKKPLFEQKKILCNALGVPSYYDQQALRLALETIITA